jgi:F-type H+-transporting ATPase subunit b
MEDIVEGVLEAEEQAKETVRKAREQAAQIRAEADREAGERLRAARNEAQEIVRTRAEAAQSEADAAYERARQAMRRDLEQAQGPGGEGLSHIADELVQLLTRTPYRRP